MPTRFVNRVWGVPGAWCLLVGSWLAITLALSAQTEPGKKVVVPAQTEPGKKVAVPDQAARAQALKDLQEKFLEEFKQAETDGAVRKKLAAELLTLAEKAGTASAEQFVLLEQAAEQAAAAGDSESALQAVEELGRRFTIDTGPIKAKVFEKAAAATTGVEESAALVETLLQELAGAVEADNFDLAGQLGKAAEDAAKRTKDLPLVLQVRRERQGVAVAQKKFAEIKPFADRLKKDPADPEANLQVGKYLCLLKGEWERGLYLLAQCSDAALRQLAQRDLIRPDEPGEQVTLGDRWWGLAEKEDGQVRVHLKQRAVHWYEQAVHTLDGAAKEKLEERITAVPPARHAAMPWDHAGPQGQIRLLGHHGSSVYGVAFSPDGKTALSGSVNNQAILWDTRTGKQMHNLQGHFGMIWSVAYDPKGKHVFTSSWDGTVKMWDVRTGQEVKRFPSVNRIADINGIAVSPDGRYLMAGTDDTLVYIWDIKSGNLDKQLKGHRGVVYGVAFSPDGRKALTGGGSDQALMYWDIKSGKILHEFRINGPIRNVAISPDGRKAVAAGESAVRLWDLQTGKEIRRFQGHAGMVYGVAFSPDGRRLVTAGTDRAIRYWDVATGAELASLSGHTSTVFSLAISPGGGRVITGSSDNTVRLWGLPRK